MSNSNKTKLSQQQIFQRSFEENSDRIRVSLGDADDDITVNPNGSINSIIQDADGNPISDLNPLHIIDDLVNAELDVQTGILQSIDQSTNDIETAVESLDNKVINNYGAANGAIRTAAQIGNTTGVANFNSGITGAQTLRTSSNITRNGTELSYNLGSSDVNTLRTSANITAVSPNGIQVNLEASGVDSGNSSSTPLGAGGVFTGVWKDISHQSNLSFMVNSNVPGVLSIQYSTDGSTIHRTLSGTYNGDPNGLYITLPPETQYYRLIYTNGGIAQSSFSLQSVLTTTPVGISTVPLNFPIVDSNSIAINRSIITGKSTDGQYLNQRAGGVSTGNVTSSPLLAGETFTGQWEEVLGYANISITTISDVASAINGIRFEYSSDGINIDAFDTYTTIAGEGNQFSSGATTKYFRIKYTNGSSNQTYFRLHVVYHITAPKSSTHRVDNSISGENDSELVKAVLTGKNPNGQFVNEAASGIVSSNSSATPLGIGGIYTGSAIDIVGFSSINVNISTDQDSAVNGLEVQFSQDGVNWDHTHRFTITANSSRGYNIAVESKFLRIRYTNGAVAQTFFRLTTILKTQSINTTTFAVDDEVQGNYLASTSKSVLAGKKENGVYTNITASNSGSLKVAVTDRPSEVRNRVKVEKSIFNVTLTTTPTIIHTVTAGKVLYLESMITSALNSANVIGEWRIVDNGVDKIGYLLPDKISGSPSATVASSPSLPEPIPFTNTVAVRSITGTIQLSFYFIGYEEDI